MPSRGREIAQGVVDLIDAGSFSMTAVTSRRRLPSTDKANLHATDAEVSVAFVGKEGDELDRGSERLQYTIGVAVSARTSGVGTTTEEARGDAIEDLIEEIQDHLSDEDNRYLSLSGGGEAELELPFVSDPIYREQLLREAGVYLSITLFNYIFDKSRT